MGRNWMQDYEERNDKRREEELNDILEHLLSDFYDARTDKDKIDLAEKIIDIYHTLELELFSYDRKQCLEIKKELVNLRYKKMKKAYQDSQEASSWEDYRDEEERREERENDDDDER